MAQLLGSPLTPFQIMLPKLLAMTLVILFATAVSLFDVARPAFGVPINGSVALVVAPMLLLSGLVAPMEAMPSWARHLMILSPLGMFRRQFQ